MADKNGNYVTTRELAAELRSMRWEMRFLIVAAGALNLGLGRLLGVPGVSDVAGLILNIF